jgi:hypothetical protein
MCKSICKNDEQVYRGSLSSCTCDSLVVDSDAGAQVRRCAGADIDRYSRFRSGVKETSEEQRVGRSLILKLFGTTLVSSWRQPAGITPYIYADQEN